MSANFHNALSAMRLHYQTNPGVPFALDAHLAAFPLSRPSLPLANAVGAAPPSESDLQAGLEQVKSSFKGDTGQSLTTQEKSISDATDALNANKHSSSAPNDFIARMKAQAEAAKKANDDAIDKAYATATEIGVHASPEQQNAILNTMNSVMSVGAEVVNKITNFISGIVGKVMDIVNGILDAYKTVKDTFSSIGGFLGHAF